MRDAPAVASTSQPAETGTDRADWGRPIDALIAQAGFSFDELETFYGKGPKSFSYLYKGVASPA